MRIDGVMLLLVLAGGALARTPNKPQFDYRYKADHDDLSSIFTDPSIESRQYTPTRPQVSTEAQRKIAERQVTRSRLIEIGSRKRKRSALGLSPKTSAALVSTCSRSFYNLDVAKLAFHAGRAWLAPRIRPVQVYKTIGKCYTYCSAQSSCRAFTWYPRGSSSQGHCYALDSRKTSKGWMSMGKDLPEQAGTYFLEGRCASGQTCCLMPTWSGFPTCSAEVWWSAGTAYFKNWHSFNNQIRSEYSTDRSDCEAYCRQTSGCFGFVWSPAETMCWLKTGSSSGYLKSAWAYNDVHSRENRGGFYMLNTTCERITQDVPSGALDSCCNS